MMLNPDFRDILSAFTAEKVEFLLVGAYALAAHGQPRATGDIDLWIRASGENAARVWLALERFGAPLEGIERKDFAVEGNVLQIGLAPRRVDILTAIDGVTFEEAWPARLELNLDGMGLPVIGRAHLIQNKQAVGRPQDLADVAWLEDRTG